MRIFNFILLDCKRATFLMSKQEEDKLSFLQAVQLRLHVGACSFCKRFQQQTKFFTSKVNHLHQHLPSQLPGESKQRIKELLK